MSTNHTVSGYLAGRAELTGWCELPITGRPIAGLPYAVSIGMAVSPAVLSGIRTGPTRLYAHHYHTINAALDQLALNCTRLIIRDGGQAVPVPASQYDEKTLLGLLPHKTTARLAGLGSIGMNALLVTERFGPAVRFVTVLTDMPPHSPPQAAIDVCTGCGRCRDACPADAIRGVRFQPGITRDSLLDARACYQYIRDRARAVGAEVCGLCISACPLASLPAL